MAVILLLLISFSGLSCYPKNCRKNESQPNGGWNLYYICCRPLVDTNGSCEECSLGTVITEIEFDLFVCAPCKDGRYGYSCRETCVCLETQRCNATQGCVNIISSSDTSVWSILDIVIGSCGYVLVVTILTVSGIALKKKLKSTSTVNQPESLQNSGNERVNSAILGINSVPNAAVINQPINASQQTRDMTGYVNGGYLEPIYHESRLPLAKDVEIGKLESKTPKISGYLNPYQPILKHQCEVHQYLTTQEAGT